MKYYTENPTGQFESRNDEEALTSSNAKIIYRESETDNGLPFIILRDVSKYTELQSDFDNLQERIEGLKSGYCLKLQDHIESVCNRTGHSYKPKGTWPEFKLDGGLDLEHEDINTLYDFLCDLRKVDKSILQYTKPYSPTQSK